jgi:23S rRNA pseudouridine1911/1915/1917 synthase
MQMTEEHTLRVETPTRLDQLLAGTWGELGRAQIRDLLVTGKVRVNGREARKPGEHLEPGDEVTVLLPELDSRDAPGLPLGMTLAVVYEDAEILVVDKPANLAVRRLRRQEHATLPHILAGMYPDMAHIGGVNRAGVVTALDRDASGLVLVGKNEATYRELRRRVKRDYVTESYTALVEGRLRGEFVIDEAIGNAKHKRERQVISEEGRPARTHVRSQQHYKEDVRDYTVVLLRPETSRMHQLQIHLAWYGHPIVGDRIYGSRQQPLLADRLFLHLSVMTILHPVTEQEVTVESALPAELRAVLSYLRRPK